MARRRTDPRARKSGFAARLDDFFRDAKTAWRAVPRRYLGPRNPSQLADWLTQHGETVSARATGNWANGDNLPEARFIALLEELLGAPWRYLDNAKNPPVSDAERELFRALYASTAEERARLASALRAVSRRGPA